MPRRRTGTSLPDVLLALVLVALTASWALQAAVATERTHGATRARSDAMHRAALALAELHALPCDTTSAGRTRAEPRWHLVTTRTSAGTERVDRVVLWSRRGDTVVATRHRWCLR